MKFDFLKFIGGFNILEGEKRGKLLFYAILISIGGFILWSAFIKPTTKQVQNLQDCFKGAKIDNVYVSQPTTKPKEKNWSIGGTIITGEHETSYGIILLRQF